MTTSKTSQMMRRIHDLGQASAKQLSDIVRSSYVSAYLRDKVKSEHIVTAVTAKGTKVFRLTEKGRAYLGVSMLTQNPIASEPAPCDAVTKPVSKVDPLDAAIEALGRAIVSRITATVEQRITSVVDDLITKQIAASVNKVAVKLDPTTPVRPRITILGLLNDQQQMIMKEFGDDMDIRCLNSNDNSGLVKSNATHSEVTFVMVDFISHSTIKLLESVHAPYIPVKGGMSSLRDALTKYFVGG